MTVVKLQRIVLIRKCIGHNILIIHHLVQNGFMIKKKIDDAVTVSIATMSTDGSKTVSNADNDLVILW